MPDAVSVDKDLDGGPRQRAQGDEGVQDETYLREDLGAGDGGVRALGTTRPRETNSHETMVPGGRDPADGQTMLTGVPNQMRRESFWMPSLYMRTHPCEASVPMDLGLLVPWMPISPSPAPKDV